jgi:cold shock CspA family protein
MVRLQWSGSHWARGGGERQSGGPERKLSSFMNYGTVVQFFPAKGYGFIRGDRGPDIFFHVSALGACREPPPIEPGQAVKYELVPGTEARPRRRPPQGEEGGQEHAGGRGRKSRTESSPDTQRGQRLGTSRGPGAEQGSPARPQARLVELIDRIPGGVLSESSAAGTPARHPRARRKKPSWKR